MHKSSEIVVRQGAALVKRQSPTEAAAAQKHFVFDLDETLGSFGEMYEIWKQNQQQSSSEASSIDFLVKLLTIFPEFLRSGIVSILQFLYQKKKAGLFGHLYIYTNNQCGRKWTENLVHAIEQVAHTPYLFDHIICAFKINNVVIESRRTSHWKTWSDFVRCTLLPTTAHICFIDDTYFPYMKRDRVFYLQPRPYEHSLSMDEIHKRLNENHLEMPESLLLRVFASPTPYDSSASDRLLFYLNEFFNMSLRRPSTRKVKGRFWYNLSQKKRQKSSTNGRP